MGETGGRTDGRTSAGVEGPGERAGRPGGIVVFGAGGRAGRAAVAEARRRGHRVTAVVRDPAAHADLAGEGVRLVAGDVTDAAAVAAAAAGHRTVISAAAAYGAGTDPAAFFADSTRALLATAREPGVRLIVVGLATLLRDAAGRPLLESAPVPPEFLPFCRAHGAALALLRQEGARVDWLYLSPAGDFDREAPGGGGYRVAERGDLSARIAQRDFAAAVLDEAERPAHHRVHLAVTGA
ncbi:NAD(P)-dependent oxidoreductase [Streptomyces hoynatensis]|uniref:NAD-dependent epimerase/dehydratase family protein n=1 Tax=Streptomyces hoynatensis TaxID=1141874 RepID=A0A3A9Z288_9ACTN|nr:NAD(P)H-binding protein [Streptomyces hoynatensis]RKN42363.1 NAD-dependent epimerase/dehydratase family protein [Streptomyces hoynatensis]